MIAKWKLIAGMIIFIQLTLVIHYGMIAFWKSIEIETEPAEKVIEIFIKQKDILFQTSDQDYFKNLKHNLKYWEIGK